MCWLPHVKDCHWKSLCARRIGAGKRGRRRWITGSHHQLGGRSNSGVENDGQKAWHTKRLLWELKVERQRDETELKRPSNTLNFSKTRHNTKIKQASPVWPTAQDLRFGNLGGPWKDGV